MSSGILCIWPKRGHTEKLYQVEQSKACSTFYCLVICPCQWANVSHVVKNHPCLESAIICKLVLVQWWHPDAEWLAKQCQLLYTATTHTNIILHMSWLQLSVHTSLHKNQLKQLAVKPNTSSSCVQCQNLYTIRRCRL